MKLFKNYLYLFLYHLNISIIYKKMILIDIYEIKLKNNNKIFFLLITCKYYSFCMIYICIFRIFFKINITSIFILYKYLIYTLFCPFSIILLVISSNSLDISPSSYSIVFLISVSLPLLIF